MLSELLSARRKNINLTRVNWLYTKSGRYAQASLKPWATALRRAQALGPGTLPGQSVALRLCVPPSGVHQLLRSVACTQCHLSSRDQADEAPSLYTTHWLRPGMQMAGWVRPPLQRALNSNVQPLQVLPAVHSHQPRFAFWTPPGARGAGRACPL